ncbi:MAG: DNA mismatch repair endonuclease MutL [Clostridiales bacterium]|nr:DNA mismatch repair endonuclease MutL [Clostridiales bacterium]
MDKIIKLSPEVIGHIAAGEVVERPSAAVKELVENSLDAGASAITVDIREGGLAFIRVSDNGSGIPESELRMAFERHATSKLRTQEDLLRIATLGFRGEALSSIAAVSRVTLLSRLRGSESGMQVVNEGGQITDIRPAPCAEGTAITVRDLFFNAPVRRKFMKKPAQETQLVADLMQRLILSHPDVSFRFTADGKTVFFSPGDGKQETAVMSIYGVNTLKQMFRVDGSERGLILTGYLGVGELSRGNRSQQQFFINGRAMRSNLLSQAVEEGCRQRVMIGRFPMFALHLTLPYEAVDVNVHPNKWEVRFSDERGVAEAVTGLVQDALSPGAAEAAPPPFFAPMPDKPGVPVTQVLRREPEELRTMSVPSFVSEPEVSAPAFPASLRSPAWEKPQSPAAPVKEPEQVTAAEHLPQLSARPVRLIGAAFNTYILFESGDTVCLCDQHAMHERLMFDRLMKAYDSGAIAQTLMVPRVIQLSYREYGSFLEYQALLAAAGYEAEDFGDQSVRLHSVPMTLGQPQAEGGFKEALEDLISSGSLNDDKRVEKIITASCKHAVKGGERLSNEELISLVRGVLDGNVHPTCPHGRPLMMQLTRNELEKRFQRIPN